MKSLVSLFVVAAALAVGQAHADQAPVASAPQPGFTAAPPATSERTPYDAVGYAGWSGVGEGVSATHRSLPADTFVEVTALDTGRTILVPIVGMGRPGPEIALSDTAAAELGLTRGKAAAVRVRVASASGPDQAALRSGRPAAARPDTPPVLLNALRRKLAGTLGRVTPDFDDDVTANAPPLPVATAKAPPPPRRPAAPPPAPAPAPAASGPGFYVQVAALADVARARAVARELGGSVSAAGRLNRVRLGPFDSAQAAQSRRDAVARRGYGDARIVRE